MKWWIVTKLVEFPGRSHPMLMDDTHPVSG
jgi:hypothetical protein